MSRRRPLAVVTGATGGIGAATTRKLLEEGYSVVAHFGSDERRAETFRETLSKEHRARTQFIDADLTQTAGIDRLVAFVEELLDAQPNLALRALVNNAAKLLGPGLADATVAQFDEYFALNARAPFFLTQRLSTRMHERGAVVNVSSAGAHFSSPGDIVYAMSKAALESLTVNAAEALAQNGVRINTVIPGFTDNGHVAFQHPAVRQHLSTFSVLGGVSEPHEVAEAIVYLLSDRASRTTGASLDVSGGSTLGASRAKGPSLKAIAKSPAFTPDAAGAPEDERRAAPS